MTDLLRDDESQPNVQPRELAFPGGAVDVGSFVATHNGPTPTTLSVTLGCVALVHYALKDLDGHLAEARRLVALGRHDEACCELGQVVALGREAIGWLK